MRIRGLQVEPACPVCGAVRLESKACAPRAGPGGKAEKKLTPDRKKGRLRHGYATPICHSMAAATERVTVCCFARHVSAHMFLRRRAGKGFDPFRLTDDPSRYALLRLVPVLVCKRLHAAVSLACTFSEPRVMVWQHASAAALDCLMVSNRQTAFCLEVFTNL